MDEFETGRVDYSDSVSMHERNLKDYSHASRKRRRTPDIPFLVLTLIILSIGIIMVFSASFARSYFEEHNATYYFNRQLFFAALGIVGMTVCSYIPVSVYRRFSLFVFGLSVFLLILVLIIGTGDEEAGARRWIDLGITTFQPSELAKIAMIMLCASMACVYREKMGTFKYGVLPFAAAAGIVCLLLYKEPHISAIVIILAITAVMMLAGGTRIFWFVLGIAVVGALGYLVIKNYDYAAQRIYYWKHPDEDPLNNGYQAMQSLLAIGSGGLFGLGLGQGRQKYLYLPEEHNDYIFAIVCEELGFVGAVLVLLLFALLIIRGFWLALHIKDRYGSLLVTGITGLLAIQVFLNVAVVTNLIPSTGVALPFFSYGGTALLFQLGEVGIVLSASRDIPLKKG